MSKLSELLNPIPIPTLAESPPEGHPLLQDAPSDYHHDQPSTMLSNVQIGSPCHKPSLQSPLEALATAATTSEPLQSPTLPPGSVLPPLGASFQSHTSSRPTSSRISPPLPLDLSRQPEHPLGSFSPGLEQYHHSSSREVRARRLSDIADGTSRTLPPLRRSLPNENEQIGRNLPNGLFRDGIKDWAHGETVAQLQQPEGFSPKEDVQLEKALDDASSDQGKSPTQHSDRPQYSPITDTTPMHPIEVEVKAEVIETSSDFLRGGPQLPQQGGLSIASAQPNEPMESALPRISDLRNDYQPSLDGAETLLRSPSANPKPAPSRKRPAPKSKVEKKGTASTVKPAAKRRKIEASSADGTPSVQRSETPASSRASKTPAPKNRKQESVTPARSSSVTNPQDDDEDDEDLELFCICRKPDDHTWMIACDGPCEDWFHGRCVGMNERDGNLIDKYICPNCKSNGVGQTTWKPMCRLETCRDPARVPGPNPSKYCSDAHGMEYMRIHAMAREPEPELSPSYSAQKRKTRRDNYTDNYGNEDNMALESEELKPNPSNSTIHRKSRRDNYTDNDGNENGLAPLSQEPKRSASQSPQARKRRRDNHADNYGNGKDDGNDDHATLHGGVLRAAQLKTLASGVKNIAEFRQLGEGVLSPPRTPPSTRWNDDDGGMKMEVDGNANSRHPNFEEEPLDEIAAKRQSLKAQSRMLDGRERFLSLVKTRAKRVLEDLRKREAVKDICGFDARLSWSDHEFLAWRDSAEGQDALESGNLTAPPPASFTITAEPDDFDSEDSADDQPTGATQAAGTTHPDGNDNQDPEDEIGRGVCQKRRCERHRAWWKLQQQDLAFEKGEVRLLLGMLDLEETGIRQRARVKRLEAKGK